MFWGLDALGILSEMKEKETNPSHALPDGPYPNSRKLTVNKLKRSIVL